VTHRQSSEAFEWIESDRRDWLFAFANVCDLLGIDTKAVRERLRIKGTKVSGLALAPLPRRRLSKNDGEGGRKRTVGVHLVRS
jgi:hypothetical protein